MMHVASVNLSFQLGVMLKPGKSTIAGPIFNHRYIMSHTLIDASDIGPRMLKIESVGQGVSAAFCRRHVVVFHCQNEPRVE